MSYDGRARQRARRTMRCVTRAEGHSSDARATPGGSGQRDAYVYTRAPVRYCDANSNAHVHTNADPTGACCRICASLHPIEESEQVAAR